MSQDNQNSRTTSNQFREHAERHLQQLHELRIQQYVLLQHTQEYRIMTQHTVALSKMLLEQISEQIAHIQIITQQSDF